MIIDYTGGINILDPVASPSLTHVDSNSNIGQFVVNLSGGMPHQNSGVNNTSPVVGFVLKVENEFQQGRHYWLVSVFNGVLDGD